MEKSLTYLIIIEKTNNGYSAYYPDLPGCITTGTTVEDIVKNAKEALSLQ